MRRYLHVGEGELIFSASDPHGRRHSHEVAGYVAALLGGRYTVIVKPAGKIEILDR